MLVSQSACKSILAIFLNLRAAAMWSTVSPFYKITQKCNCKVTWMYACVDECMHVCCMSVCGRGCEYARMYASRLACVCVCMHVCQNGWLCISGCQYAVCIHVDLYVYFLTYVFVHAYVCKYVSMRMHIYVRLKTFEQGMTREHATSIQWQIQGVANQDMAPIQLGYRRFGHPSNEEINMGNILNWPPLAACLFPQHDVWICHMMWPTLAESRDPPYDVPQSWK